MCENIEKNVVDFLNKHAHKYVLLLYLNSLSIALKIRFPQKNVKKDVIKKCTKDVINTGKYLK